MLELADEQFVEIRSDIEEYGEKIKELLSHSYEGILIDNITLENYISISDEVKRIDTKISLIRKVPLETKINPRRLEVYAKLCKFHNIVTIKELDELIKQNENNILGMTWFFEMDKLLTVTTMRSYFTRKNIQIIEKGITEKQAKTERPVSTSSLGLAIWILGYVLLCNKKDAEYTKHYLKSMDLSAALVDKIHEFCAKSSKNKFYNPINK